MDGLPAQLKYPQKIITRQLTLQQVATTTGQWDMQEKEFSVPKYIVYFILSIYFFRMEECPPGGISTWRRVCLEACLPGGAELESCPPGGLQLEGCPAGGT